MQPQSYGIGSGPYGTMPYGTEFQSTETVHEIILLPIRENVLRLIFDVAPRFTQLLDPYDASDPRRYTVTPVPGTVDSENVPTKPVRVIAVEIVEGSDWKSLDITFDRAMSSYPGKYTLTTNGIVSDGTLADININNVTFDALRRGAIAPVPELMVNNRDIANPQSRMGLYDPLPLEEGQRLDPLLGTFREDSQGDVAYDEGIAGVSKRIFRRLTTKRGKFLHLPNYGVSINASVKQLSRPGLREALAVEAEEQIIQEPEVTSVTVNIVVDDAHPNIARYQIRARTVFGDIKEFSVPIQPAVGA